MNKKTGFTIIELLIVITISLILAVISIPSMMKWYKKDQFLNQTQEIMDNIYDARAYSISSKKCSNGNDSMSWSFSLKNSSFLLKCHDSLGGEFIEKTTGFNDSLLLEVVHFSTATDGDIENGVILNNDIVSESLNLKFINVSGQSKIYLSPNENFSMKKARMRFYFAHEDSFMAIPGATTYNDSFKRTICINRFSGFPTISSSKDCND